MIEIPDEGLRVWICKHTSKFAGSMEVLTSESVTFPKGDDGCCDDDGYCEVGYGYCDAIAYRIVKEATVVVAPGIMVSPQEYEQRYQGIDLTSIRQRMPPDLFRDFVRYIGSIPGHPDTDAELWGEKGE